MRDQDVDFLKVNQIGVKEDGNSSTSSGLSVEAESSKSMLLEDTQKLVPVGFFVFSAPGLSNQGYSNISHLKVFNKVADLGT